MIKRFKSIVSLLLILITIFSLCSCSKGEYRIYYVQDAYKRKLISKEDWLNIAVYYAQQYDDNVYDENFKVIEVKSDKLKQLSNAELIEIKNAYYNFHLSVFNSLLADEIISSKQEILDSHIDVYNCGVYDGKYAVAIYSDLVTSAIMEPWYMTIDNIRVAVFAENQIYIISQ